MTRLTNDFDDDSITDGWRTFWWEFVGMGGQRRCGGFLIAFVVAVCLLEGLLTAIAAIHRAGVAPR